jgi:transcriptional regulator with XRE-family HTH domain
MELNWSEIDMRKVGNKLFYIRESKEQTQDEFIEGCSITRRQYSKYENGLQKPRYQEENFLKLLFKHGIDVEWLLYEDDVEIDHIENLNNDTPIEETVSLYLEIKTKSGVEILNIKNKPLKYLDKIKKYIELTVN